MENKGSGNVTGLKFENRTRTQSRTRNGGAGGDGKAKRRETVRRLAYPVFKMADASMAEFIENRPFHLGYINKKLSCPRISCRGEDGKVFFEEKGLAQHFRAKHAGVFFDEEEFTREAWRLFKFLHGEETKQHLERLTAGRLRQVYFVAFLLFSSYCIYCTLYFSSKFINRLQFS